MMSQVDKQALRKAAMNATHGPWEEDECGNVLIVRDGIATSLLTSVVGYDTSGLEDIRNAVFIAAANPATMLALLDENEALEKRVAELAEEIANLKAKALYWDADNTESSYEDPTDIANDLDLNPGDHFYVQVAYLDKDREYIVNDDRSVSCTQLVDNSAAVAQKLLEAKA
ncbi:Uncharacterised protein [Edwardsiella hoshinae]|uniref:Ead/Ea22-like family protein n=1 Tax=Edwardsiella hoshinae TaxID=93378 RepID=A0A376DID2_9GAMM|nr:ead/Ea22-like family protein [Edwardsiella hoshinae]STC89375.1 Uncharacterised protein [Edwardsiella hoshinae]